MEAILAAILFLQPALSQGTASKYAHHIYYESARHDLDPFLVVALIHYESRWNPKADSKKGDFGLMQVRARAHGYSKKQLLNPEVNIRVGTAALAYWRTYHRTMCGRNSHYWWAHYQHGVKVASNVSARRVRQLRDKLYRHAEVLTWLSRSLVYAVSLVLGKTWSPTYWRPSVTSSRLLSRT